MKRSLVLYIICGVLSLSVLAPAVCTLLEVSVETSLVSEGDDESKKEKTEKELEEKQWDAPRSSNSLLGFKLQQTNNFGVHPASLGIIAPEVSSPPPEQHTCTPV